MSKFFSLSEAIYSITIILIFVLIGAVFVHNFASINADIGRHIKLGEIIWQTKEVPKTNLLSYTAPDFPFINHHWLSEVVFYGVYSLGGDWISGLKALILFKATVLLATYLFLFLIIKKYNIFVIVLSLLVSIFVFSARTETRPEIFSYLIFAVYLFVIYRIRELSRSDLKNPQGRTFNWLWILPILQLFWVNLHIYFIIGPIIYLLFLIEKFLVSKKISFKYVFIGIAVLLANLVNPNFIDGALYPLKVFNSYGYSVVENMPLFYLSKYYGYWTPQDKLFLTFFFIFAGSFLFWLKSQLLFLKQKRSLTFLLAIQKRTFDLLLAIMTVILSFKMQRNIPLYALALWPIMAENLNYEWKITNKLKEIFRFIIILILIGTIYLVVSNRFYDYFGSAKMFGLGVSKSVQDGTDFVKRNNIQGSVFNNFDIGSYLVWQLFPDQKVFVDGRPEAYPPEFFEQVYKPMHRDEKKWQEMVGKYGINYVFFAHTDLTEWAEEFLTRIFKDENWPLVFLNDSIVILLKNTETNRAVIEKYKITEQNIKEMLPQMLEKLDKNDGNAFINYGSVLYRLRWFDNSVTIFESLIMNQPDNPYGYQGAGYAYGGIKDIKAQRKAAENLRKAIDLGLETFNNYLALGITHINIGDLFTAEENIKKALEIDPNHKKAIEILEIVKAKKKL